jgi:NAD(P)-dependent dehydrogenase (short-subunit alcohol dehydrogenase family)
MSKQGKGSIVNTASIAGLNPGAGPHLYATAKAAVVFFTGSAALELGEYDVRVNCVCPGGVATELVSSALGAGADILPAIEESMRGRQAIERPGQTMDIARTVLWLASDESDYVTGQAIAIDGGENYGAKWSKQAMQ